MHNLLSRSQLDEWRHLEKTANDIELQSQLETENDRLNDYYECLIECDALSQHASKKICREILM